jgi:undecaprenyl diphosphate synthase
MSKPRHIGIIMDGNGRWATARGLRRSRGHREGVTAAKRVVTEAIAQEIEYVTLYAFSTENWRRSKEEVSFLMGLLARHLRIEYDYYRENNVRVLHAGNIQGLPQQVRREIARVSEETSENTALTVILAVNYGGRDEVVRAVNRWLETNHGSPDARLSELDLAMNLDVGNVPDPDLVIRTAGERRISNFLLWQCAYSELYFSDRLWPDWGAEELREALRDYAARMRNFGGMPESASAGVRSR